MQSMLVSSAGGEREKREVAEGEGLSFYFINIYSSISIYLSTHICYFPILLLICIHIYIYVCGQTVVTCYAL